MPRLMRCNRYADCAYESCVHFSIHDEITDFFHMNGVCDGECSVFSGAHCIYTGEGSRDVLPPEWDASYLEYCDIFGSEPSINNQVYFLAGMQAERNKNESSMLDIITHI